jgi:hypothetical protein
MSDPVTPYITARAKGMLGVLIVAVGGLFGYSIHEQRTVSRLSAENTQVVTLLKDTRAQMQALSAKLDSMAAPPVAQEVKPSAAAIPDVKPAPTRKRTAIRRAASDSRFKKFQRQLDAQGQAIESTRQELASTRTDLQGSIARTHDELVVLQKKGERNYYEFDLDKSKQFRRSGPVGVSLRKVNTKHMYADLELMVNDAQLSKKHVNLFEPVFFYAADEHRPVELVINAISKNHIHGYISGPRYTATELAATSSATPADASATNGQSTQDSGTRQRQRLAVPR